MLNAELTTSVANEKPKSPRYEVSFAKNKQEIIECQKLRYEVFAQEMGAELDSAATGLDQDQFDEHCQHLMVRDNKINKVIATTRIITNEIAEKAGSYYSETEFDIREIVSLDKKFMEIGRTCVHMDYRSSSAINHLWQGVAKTMITSQVDYMFGCVSIPMSDDGEYINSLMQYLVKSGHMSTENKVSPKVPLTQKVLPESVDVVLPSLLKRYLHIGAKICGEPCIDEKFNVADIFILVDTKKINKRYQRHFLESA